MPAMTVKDLLDAKGKRQLAHVQVAQEEEAIAASAAGMDMIGFRQSGWRRIRNISQTSRQVRFLKLAMWSASTRTPSEKFGIPKIEASPRMGERRASVEKNR